MVTTQRPVIVHLGPPCGHALLSMFSIQLYDGKGWVSLVAQLVKNPPAIPETWVLSLGWEHSLENGIEIHSSILAWRIPMDRGAWRTTVRGVTKSQTL